MPHCGETFSAKFHSESVTRGGGSARVQNGALKIVLVSCIEDPRNENKRFVAICQKPRDARVTQTGGGREGGLTLAGVSLAVSESDQRCLSWEELGTHSQKFCMGQTDKGQRRWCLSGGTCAMAHAGTCANTN